MRGTGIAFTGSQTITDTGSGLGVFPVNATVKPLLSTANGAMYNVATSSAGTLTIDNPTTVAETAGAAIELHRVG